MISLALLLLQFASELWLESEIRYCREVDDECSEQERHSVYCFKRDSNHIY